MWDNTIKCTEGGGSQVFVLPEKGGEGRLFNRLALVRKTGRARATKFFRKKRNEKIAQLPHLPIKNVHQKRIK